MQLPDPAAEAQYQALVQHASDLVVGLDFDGTLSPIVEDPTQARIHPDAPALLVAVAEVIRGIAVITGRPARQALALGDLDHVGAQIATLGKQFLVLGQYGNERWTADERRVISPRPPSRLAAFLRDVPRLLRTAGTPDAFVEEKGLAVALHTRRLPDPAEAFSRLLPQVEESAARHGLAVEPGRLVVEVRAPGMHKGLAVRGLVEETGARAFLFAGDDLGDVEAFSEVGRMRESGMPTLLVCSDGGDGPEVLAEMADVVVPGPDGVLALLERFRADVLAQRA